jgi:DinB superfamily
VTVAVACGLPLNEPLQATSEFGSLTMTEQPPDNPAGPIEPIAKYDEQVRTRLTEIIRDAPANLRQAVTRLADAQLDTLYKNWTIRQIVHHIADSHLHSIVRFKWTLTEDHPTIKAYAEGDWVQLADAKAGELEPALLLLAGLHAKWVQVLQSMTAPQFGRTFHHPQSGQSVSLWLALNNYAWHGRHHTAQILWLRKHHDW